MAAATSTANNTNPGDRRLPIIGVMGSGSIAHADIATPLGQWLASTGVNILTGGGGGVMQAVSQAFYEVPDRQGVVIAVLPSADQGNKEIAKPGYPNPFVEIPIQTHLPLSGAHGTDPLSRNHINVLSSDVVVALPGGAGTASEIALCRRYTKPIAVFGGPSTVWSEVDDTLQCCRSLKQVQEFLLSTLQMLGFELEL
ncbi:MAG: molybdenum cofactor carrier protein [Gammaproteobacteria bacterium]|nr:molybdenum cofactor carrier protein [Gammaproteobacteria bacterium]